MQCNEFGYEPLDRWPQLPPSWTWMEAAAVAVDSKDRVFVFNRSEHPVIVFAPDGSFLTAWGEGLFARPHGIFIGPDDSVYLTDDLGHAVFKFTPEGKPLLSIGVPGRPSETGVVNMDFRTIRQSAPPFNFPTNVALADNGDIYVTDGYGNARVHKFNPDGRLLFSWGEPGSAPGQFNLPHGIAVAADGTVYVADRENSRIQLFTQEGKFIDQWTDVARPCQVFVGPSGDVYVAELGFRAGMWPGTSAPTADATGGRLSIFDASGKPVARWGGGENPCASGDFFAPHGIWADSRGDIYLAEVVMSAGGNRGLVPADCRSLQKFVRQSTGT